MIGTKLGPYEITGKLGEGGMGEVYRATDSRLKREVAVKVLPAAFTADKERLARFEREAQLLAQLHHPNIASIFGLEESDGVRALVMELVEGEDLSARIARGALPTDEALPIARQIAEALESAHEQGIVHRDLKPANVKLRADGTVKVLDFGLAKALEPAAAASSVGGPGLANSPTLTAAPGTQLGVILGTAAYMAPEQARGGAADRRADVWAFGVILHEMLTGRQLFAGETVSDTLAAVLRADIDFGTLPAELPAEVRRLLRRCLERNPKDRLHDIADARIVIAEILAGRGDDPLAVPLAAPPPLWRRALPWSIAGAVALAWATWATLGTTRQASRAPDAQVAFTVPWTAADGSAGLLRSVTVSRDGRRLVLWDSIRNLVLLRDLAGFESRVLEATLGAGNPFLSPDGQWLGFNADGELKKLALDGGVPVTLCDVPTDSPGGAWGTDGFIYYTPTWTSGLWRVADQGGEPEGLTLPDRSRGESLHAWPSVLPGGEAVVFTIWGSAGIRDARVALLDVASREITPLLAGGAAQFVATGHLVFFRHGAWLAVPFDAATRRVTGAERRVLAGGRPLNPLGGRERTFSFADNGLLAYIAAPTSYYTPHTQLAWVDRQGRVEPLPFEGQHEYSSLALSPDGSRVAVALTDGGEIQVWVYDLVSGAREPVTRDGLNLHPRWHPDGSRLAVTSLHRGDYDLREVRSDGGGAPAVLVASDDDDSELEWDLSGSGFVYMRSTSETGQDIWLHDGATGRQRPLVATPLDDSSPHLSPDGRWLLYESGSGLYVTDFPQARQRTQVAAGSHHGAWSAVTPELFVLHQGKVVAVRYEVVGDRFRVLDSRVLFDAPRLSVEVEFVVSSDAQRFLFLIPVPGKTLEAEVRVLTDGFAMLRDPAEGPP